MTQEELGTMKVPRLLMTMALPLIIAQIVNGMYNLVDRIFLGHIEGKGAEILTGVGLTYPIILIISAFSSLIGNGGAPRAATCLGQGNRKKAEEILSTSAISLLLLSFALMAFFYALKEPLLYLFGASERTAVHGSRYLMIYLAGTPFVLITLGLNPFISMQGKTTMSMLTVIIGAAMNIVLDPIFIFLFDMGVRGAAIATVISQACSCAFVLWFLFSDRVHVKISFGGYSAKIMRRVLTFGFCPFIIIAGDSVLIIALNTVLQQYGGAQGDMLIACATIVQSYMQIVTLPLGGITSGTQPILSFNYGAKNIDRIRQGEKEIVKMAFAFCLVMFIISQTVSGVFVRLFTQNPEYIALSIQSIRIYTFGIIPLALQYSFVDGLTALGIIKVSVSLSVFRKVLFLVFTLALPVFFGASSAFYAEPIVDIFCGLFSTAVFLSIIGRVLRKRQEMPEGQSLYS